MFLITVFLLMALGNPITCIPQDLSGKMFTFPQQSFSLFVKITTPEQSLGAATVCLRFFTDLTREYSLFSLRTPSEARGLTLVVNRPEIHDIHFTVQDEIAKFYGQNVKLNAWQSLCGTWDAGTGLTQIWLNGNPSCRKFTSTSHLNGTYSIILGQEQTGGGSFNVKQAFVGMMSDLHMWDYVLTRDQIRLFSNKDNFPHGNILTWASLDFQTSGRVTQVFTEDEQML